MKILVTGGAGFIGSHLCDALIERKHNVICVDNLSLGLEKNIIHLNKNKNFKFHKLDILDYKKLLEIMKNEKIDVVFHLAANSDIARSNENSDIDMKNTFMTTYNILCAMKDTNIKKIVFSSTSAIYGKTNRKINEDYSPLFPVSHYGAAKLASEAFISAFVNNYDMQAWIVRFPNVVGERATHGAIFDFINKLKKNPKELGVLGDGEQNKPYLYVKDVVDAILFIWEHSDDKLNYYNIGAETRTKVKRMAELVIKNMKLDAKIKYAGGEIGWVGDVKEFEYDISKIKKLGWKPSMSSDEAVDLAIKKILENN